MLLSINYVRTDIKTEQFHYTHSLVDADYTKKFVIVADSTFSMLKQHAVIANGILEFIYNNYRDTRECPFRNIKTLYDAGGLQYTDSIVRSTSFYGRYTKVMDRILRPVAVTPFCINDYTTTDTVTDFVYANYNTGTTTFTANTQTYATTINVAYPAQYMYTLRVQ